MQTGWQNSFRKIISSEPYAEELKRYSMENSLGSWTRSLTGVVVKTCEALNWYAAAKGNKMETKRKGFPQGKKSGKKKKRKKKTQTTLEPVETTLEAIETTLEPIQTTVVDTTTTTESPIDCGLIVYGTK